VIDELYGPVLERFWPTERRIIEEGDRNIQFPMLEIAPPELRMMMAWSLAQLTGYLRTWSAVKRYQSETGVNPVETLHDILAGLWGDPGHARTSRWSLSLRVWTQTRG
jgi:hypothetical protein